jgi:hypothetical protein
VDPGFRCATPWAILSLSLRERTFAVNRFAIRFPGSDSSKKPAGGRDGLFEL